MTTSPPSISASPRRERRQPARQGFRHPLRGFSCEGGGPVSPGSASLHPGLFIRRPYGAEARVRSASNPRFRPATFRDENLICDTQLSQLACVHGQKPSALIRAPSASEGGRPAVRLEPGRIRKKERKGAETQGRRGDGPSVLFVFFASLRLCVSTSSLSSLVLPISPFRVFMTPDFPLCALRFNLFWTAP